MYKNLTLLFSIFLGLAYTGSAQTTTYSYTGAVQTWTVPAGVTTISVDMQGAMGGHAGPGLGITTPGCGGRVQAVLAVTGGQVLNIYVGGAGPDGAATGVTGGFNGGGNAAPYLGTYSGGGGGGASDIRIGGTAPANIVASAAGGGGAGYNPDCITYGCAATGDQPGGYGGGLTGGDATICTFCIISGGAPGATASTGGNTTSGTPGAGGVIIGDVPGTNGSLGAGGNSGAGVGGGGGGGYYGGGGGCWMGGGGGSSYAGPIASGVTIDSAYNCDTGVIVICAPVPGTIVGSTIVNTCSTGVVYDTTGTPGGIWSVTNTAIATIDAGGVIFPVAPGVDTIYYTISLPGCGSGYAFSVVTVNAAPKPITGPTTMCLTAPPSVSTDDTIHLSDLTPGGVWISGNTAVATVSLLTAIVYGLSTGTVTITYGIAGGCFATTILTILPPISPIAGPAALCVGDSVILTDPAPGGTWSSSQPGAPINALTGLLKGIAPAVTEVTYKTSPGCFAQKFVQVNLTPVPIAAPDSQVCASGSPLILTEPITGGTWTASPPAIVTVFPIVFPTVGAEVFGAILTGGTATITYTIAGCPPVTFPVTVEPAPAPITGITNICSGVPTTLYDASPGGYWLSSGSPYISIGSATGVVTGIVVGSTSTIFYIVPHGAISCLSLPVTVTVDSSASPIFGPDSVCIGATTQLFDSSSGVAFGGNGIWTSDTLAIAQIVDTSGVVSGISAGTVHISYTLPTGCYATKTFTVSPLTPAIVSAARYPSTILCSGDSITLVASSLHGGVNPTFVWDSFGVNLGKDGLDTIGFRPIHGDVIYLTMITHGVCAVHDTVIDTIPLNVYPLITAPTITINVDPTLTFDTNATLGQVYTFYSTVVFGGINQKYQWYSWSDTGRGPIPGATNSSVSIAIYHNDTIFCDVTGDAPCDSFTFTGRSNPIIIHAPFVQVNSVSPGDNNLMLFPNPNNGSFTLTGKVGTSNGKDVTLEVTDMLGRVVYTGSATPQNGMIRRQIALSNLSPGTYLLRMGTESGNEVLHFVVGQ